MSLQFYCYNMFDSQLERWYIDSIKSQEFDAYFYEPRNTISDSIDILSVIKFVNFLYWHSHRINLIKL